MNQEYIKKIIHQALKEDIKGKDITTSLLIPAALKSKAIIFIKESATVSGVAIARNVFHALDPHLTIHSFVTDGQSVKKGAHILSLEGHTRAILTAERVALNFLTYLSGIASKTRSFVQAVHPYPVQIYDTRKTTPTLRLLERWAVTMGGGHNHRLDLKAMILVKDNHLAAIQSIKKLCQAISTIRQLTQKKIEVEVDNLSDFVKVIQARPDIVLLDNMAPSLIHKAVMLRKKMNLTKILLEASGGINLFNVRQYAKIGVERLSIGSLTHTHQGIDFSLEIIKSG